jgi:hypothetical protein
MSTLDLNDLISIAYHLVDVAALDVVTSTGAAHCLHVSTLSCLSLVYILLLTDVEQAALSPDNSDAFDAVAAGLLLVVAAFIAGGVGLGSGLEAAGVVLPAAGGGSHGGGGEEGDDGSWVHGAVGW